MDNAEAYWERNRLNHRHRLQPSPEFMVGNQDEIDPKTLAQVKASLKAAGFKESEYDLAQVNGEIFVLHKFE
jgi:hypothetical protein